MIDTISTGKSQYLSSAKENKKLGRKYKKTKCLS